MATDNYFDSRGVKFSFPDIFSQISDSAGVMVHSQFDQFLREALKLPKAVFEGPSFGYTEQAARTCFTQQVRGVRPLSGRRGGFKFSLSLSFSRSLRPTEKGLPQYVPGHVDVGPAPSVSGVVTAHASAHQRGER